LDCSINAVSEVGDADFESDVEDDKTVWARLHSKHSKQQFVIPMTSMYEQPVDQPLTDLDRTQGSP
jgi:hypothetical protein